MIDKLCDDLAEADGEATLIGPGHSSQIFSEFVYRGLHVGFNNSDEDCKYQILADQVATKSEHGIYNSMVPEDEFPNQTTMETADSPEHRGPLFENGKILHFRPTASFALSTLVLHGATDIYIIGVDGCDPTGNGWRSYPRYTEQDLENMTRFDGLEKLIGREEVPERRLELYSQKLAYFEATVKCAVEYHDVKIYNLSPFVKIDGTNRLFDKHGAVGKYNSSKAKVERIMSNDG